MNSTVTEETFINGLTILNYILVGTTTTIIIICAFWIWYYISSVFLNKRKVANVNKRDLSTTTNNDLHFLKSQRIKQYLFLSILIFEMIRKILALTEYFYVANLDQKYHYIELPSNQGVEQECPKDMHDMVMKRPMLILIHSLNFTATLCLVSMVGITMLYLTKMYKGDRKLTSVHGLVVLLAIKGVLVLILSSTVFLHVAGYFVWLFCLIFDWFLIAIFAIKLNNTISAPKHNRDMPVELKLTPNHTREHRVITCITTFITGFVLLYIIAQIVGVSIDIADLVIIRPCYLREFGIWIRSSTMQEMLEFMQIRDGLIAMVYGVCFIFDFTIIAMHFFLLLRNLRKVCNKLLCKQSEGYASVKKVELQEPLLSDNHIWTDETYVKKIQGSSSIM